MMAKPKCPCHGCTPETGRSPDCHGDACPHGWNEYQRAYQEYHDALVSSRRADAIADSVAVSFRRRTAKKNKHH